MKQSFSNIICVFLASISVISSSIESQCDYYIAPSRVLKNGMGIFAGRNYNESESKPHSITVRYPSNGGWQLSKYVYSAVAIATELSNTVILEFGPSSIYNHHANNNVQHKELDDWNDYQELILPQIAAYQHLEANTIFPLNYFKVLKDILPGEEMYNTYGDQWFEDKGIQLSTPTKDESSYPSMTELKRVGHCLSNIHTNRSKVIAQESTGQGVFASVDFKEGELVDVSPVLVLPKHEVQEASGSSCVLINFCFSRSGSDLAFLPIGYGAVCNHGGRNANVAIEWYWWGGNYNETVLSTSPGELLNSEFAQIYFGYRAIRDIEKGEEILIDYGTDWEADWNKYLQAKQDFQRFKEEIPLFRRSIDMPESMFSDNWYVGCVGNNCDADGNILPDFSLALSIISHYPEILDVYWENDETPVTTVPPHQAQATVINTFAYHTFMFKHKDKVIQVYTATTLKQQTVVIDGSPQHRDEL